MALRIARREEQAEEQCAFGYAVKNTFIDFCAPHSIDPSCPTQHACWATQHRSSSAPPALRGGRREGDADIMNGADKGEWLGTWSTACTSAGDEMSGDEWRAGDDEETVSLSSCGQGSPRLTCSESPAGGRIELVLSSLVPGPQPKTSPSGRTALRSAARVWTPNQMMLALNTTMAFPPPIQSQFLEVVSAGKVALEKSIGNVRIEMIEASGGWSLVAHVHAQQLNLGQVALALAQEAMLAAAELSDKVYIIGYEAQPFAPLPGSSDGFTTQLAKVRDEDSACWDLLAAGVCRRGCACRWQHPSWQATLQLSLEVERREERRGGGGWLT